LLIISTILSSVSLHKEDQKIGKGARKKKKDFGEFYLGILLESYKSVWAYTCIGPFLLPLLYWSQMPGFWPNHYYWSPWSYSSPQIAACTFL